MKSEVRNRVVPAREARAETHYSMDIVAHIENTYKEKFGVPRQSGLVDEVISRIVFEEKYRNPDAVRGLHQFSHLWLIWIFSEKFAAGTHVDPLQGDDAVAGTHVDPLQGDDAAAGTHADPLQGNDASGMHANLSQDTVVAATAATDDRSWSPTVRPPRLGGNERIGVWASRSPNRPNPIGLSCVEIVSVEPDTPDGPVITVRGADLMDRTPIIDIKPYIVYADSRPDAVSGYASEAPEPVLTVTGLDKLPSDIDASAVEAILSLDPRPAYRQGKADEHVYHVRYGNHDICFTIVDKEIRIMKTDSC